MTTHIHDAARAALAASPRWRKARRSQGDSGCVELTGEAGWVGVRDTKLGAASPILAVPTVHFVAFVAELPSR